MIKPALAEYLLKKWSPVLEATKHIESEDMRLDTAVVLENTERMQRRLPTLASVNEAIAPGTGLANAGMPGLNTPDDGSGVLGQITGYTKPTVGADPNTAKSGSENNVLPTLIIPMVRRIFPELMAHDTTSVQPMTGPVGFAFAYRAMYGDVGQIDASLKLKTVHPKVEDRELGYKNMYATFTGAEKDLKWDENGHTTKADAKAAFEAYYAGTGRAKDLFGQGALTIDGEWAAVGRGENPQFPSVSFNLLHKEVVARTRKLSAHWSLDVQEDANAMQGIDISEEMMSGIGYELAAEIDRQLLSSQVYSALNGNKFATWTPASADGFDQIGRLQTLMTEINYRANLIAENTRRGAANFAIASTKATSLIQRFQQKVFTPNENGKIPSIPNVGVGSLLKVGLINEGNQLLIRDTFAHGDYVLLGFRGNQKGDTGIIFCPYVPVQMMKAVDPTTFSPILGARTRYGVLDNVWGSENYYYFIGLEGLADTVPGIHAEKKFTFFSEQ